MKLLAPESQSELSREYKPLVQEEPGQAVGVVFPALGTRSFCRGWLAVPNRGPRSICRELPPGRPRMALGR